ncbi:hypothetical protein FNQ90_06980 [Streptomyces alkaliphilus]|uniref:Semialdehyde dehydrogenase NAD-binding domain-containing protein n=1 Tax=Streptomyces alkaliphilus TaxID=1472722 RepID=A0A7W3TCA1_9ACTN|nr:hypothetical protein [Streptomyces alkaliphilus]MBB0243855.1 hypothetical protein [Streptomyces alkaliphilus]
MAGSRRIPVLPLEDEVFEGADVVFLCSGAGVNRRWAHPAAHRGALVVDTSDAFRGDPDVSPVVPEVNGATAARLLSGSVVASPRPMTRATAVQLLAAGSPGKYVPGVMWSIVLQVRLAASSGITVLHFTAAFGLYGAVVLATGCALGAPTLLGLLHDGGAAPASAVATLLGLLAMPWLLGTANRLVRRVPALGRRLAVIPADVLRRSVWLCGISRVVTGLHLWVLVVALGADPMAALIPCVGGFAPATAPASPVVILPDGTGVREALLAVAPVPLLSAPEAAAAAAAGRLVLAATDVLAFGYGTIVGRRPPAPLPSRSPRVRPGTPTPADASRGGGS